MNIIFFFLTYNEVTDNVGGICCTLLQIKYNFQQKKARRTFYLKNV